MKTIDERLVLFLQELKGYCAAKESYEFEYFIEIWSAFYWMPWFIEIVDTEYLRFSADNISAEDLDFLAEKECIQLLEIVEPDEGRIELLRRKYKLINANPVL